MDKVSEQIAKKIDEYMVHGGTPSAEELIHIIEPLVAQLEAKAKDMELMATDAMDRYSDAVDKHTDEIAQLEDVVKMAKIFVDQSEDVAWKGINPQLGDGAGSIDPAYNNLKQSIAKLEELLL